MRHEWKRQRVEPQQIFKVEHAKGAIIHMRSGLAWLTETDGTDDHFLGAEQTYRIRKQGLVLIESADRKRIEFEMQPPPHAFSCRLIRRAARGVSPVQRLKARWKALGSEKPVK